MPKQLLFGLHGEGKTDYRFLGQLLFRYIPQRLLDKDMDIETLPFVELKGVFAQGFVDKMLDIERTSEGIQGILVHMDADSRDESDVIITKWTPFIEVSSRRGAWIPIIPVQNIESWMLCDRQALADLFILDLQKVDQIVGSSRPENIADGKAIIRDLVAESDYDVDMPYIQENLGKRISLQRLSELSSFKKFVDRLDTFLSQVP